MFFTKDDSSSVETGTSQSNSGNLGYVDNCDSIYYFYK